MVWIRSQNKGVLLNANSIWVQEGIKSGIYASSDGTDIFLGNYSEAEALQVLDNIHNHAEQLYYYSFNGNAGFIHGPVFQMPEAGFSDNDTPTLAQGGEAQ